jgi:hypothetical protein
MPRLLRHLLLVVVALGFVAVAVGCSHTQAAVSANG